MDKKQQEFLIRLRETFRLEADEHLRAMSAGILRLEKGLPGEEHLATAEAVFREAHSLKGAARAVNLTAIETVCQSLETVFSAVKVQEIGLSPPLFDRLHAALSLMGDLVAADSAEHEPSKQPHVAQVVRGLNESLHRPASSPAPAGPEKMEPKALPEPQPKPKPQPAAAEMALPRHTEKGILPSPETVRISTTKLNSIMLQAEEMVSAKLALGQRVVELRESSALLASWERQHARIWPELRTLLQDVERQEMGNGNDGRWGAAKEIATVAAFCQSTEHEMKGLQAKLILLAKSTEQDRRTLSTMVDRLLDDTRKALMLPFTTFLESIPMLVRDLARSSGKEVRLVIHGGEIEADRRILEEMKDPLVHLIRNCVDHGIEKPRERERKRKPAEGTITIGAFQKDGGKVEILVSDDGAGINPAEVRASGLKSGAISPADAETMDEAATVALIFQSGVTTSPIVTDLSGRGLGLAIVREKVEKLGGTVTVESRLDLGTSFRMTLPMTFAAFRGVLVRAKQQLLIVPSMQVVHALKLDKSQIKSAENRETIEQDGKIIPLVHLSEVLGISGKSAPADATSGVNVVVLTSADQRMAFAVDEIQGEQEVLVKSLGQQLPRVRNISGAAVLGTGRVVLVLNVSELMQSVPNVTTGAAARVAEAKPPEERLRRLLVAEDSVTTRTLLKGILESTGYTVKTAVDGVDALALLRTEEFDLVVSDVEMPRMNGFGLTSAIRADERLGDLPVVLVTALDSREDRERGIDVGANAYIVKSSFEQSNLLEVVQRLI